ncbi:TIGR04149 family rSAM-modified RiPP [Nibrella viscosa]
MKQMLTKFAENLLSKEQMKSIKGGYDYSYCTIMAFGGGSSCYSSFDDAAYAYEWNPQCQGVRIERIP